jgi:hypothetical protein
VNTGGGGALGRVLLAVGTAALLDVAVVAESEDGAITGITGVEVGSGTDPRVGVAACVGVASAIVALSDANAELAATWLLAVSETVVKYVVRVDVSWYVAAK